MSKHEWKPGDVGISTIGERFIVTCDLMCAWHSMPGSTAVSGRPADSDRPLVVIDPNGDEVTDLAAALAMATTKAGLPWEGSVGERASVLRDVLREFANPTPPKPDEPTGLGAVVEDAKGDRWVRTFPDGGPAKWRVASLDLDREPWAVWSSIAAVRVLSEGVS